MRDTESAPLSFPFSQATKDRSTDRQSSRCARCETDLTAEDTHAEAHHMVNARTAGLSDDPDVHAHARSEDNCAILCDDCHLEVHDERFAGLVVEGPYEWNGLAATEEERAALVARYDDVHDDIAAEVRERETAQAPESVTETTANTAASAAAQSTGSAAASDSGGSSTGGGTASGSGEGM